MKQLNTKRNPYERNCRATIGTVEFVFRNFQKRKNNTYEKEKLKNVLKLSI